MTEPSPETIWTTTEHLEAAGDLAGLAAELRRGHAAGWPGFLYHLALRLPLRARAQELSELAQDPLPLPRFVAARAYALRGELDLAEITANRALDVVRASSVIDPEVIEDLTAALRAAERRSAPPLSASLSLLARVG